MKGAFIILSTKLEMLLRSIYKEALDIPSSIIQFSYLAHILVGSLLIILSGLLFVHYRAWRKGWLSGLVDEDIRKRNSLLSKLVDRLKYFHSLSESIYYGGFSGMKLRFFGALEWSFWRAGAWSRDAWNIRIPSEASFITFLFSLALFFYLTHPGVNYQMMFSLGKLKEFLIREVSADSRLIDVGNLVTIIGGLASLVLAQMIFVAESLRDDPERDFDKRRALLNSSYIWPLFAVTAFTFLNFFWLKIYVVTFILPVAVALGVVYSFGITLKNLIEPQEFKKTRNDFLRKKLKEIMRLSARARVGTNILLSRLSSKENPIQYMPSEHWIRGKKDYIFLECPGAGWISDVHVNQLAETGRRLEDAAKELGFTILDRKNEKGDLEIQDFEAQASSQKAEPPKLKPVYLLKRFGEQISDPSLVAREKNYILALPKEFEGHLVYREIKATLGEIFKFSTKDSAAEMYRNELRGTKDRLIQAITSLSLGEVEEISRVYIELAEAFLDVLQEFGGGYSEEQAQKELASFTGSWEEMGWITQDVRDVLRLATDSKNKEIYADIAFIPAAIATRAIRAGDHLMYRQFLGLIPYEYYLASKVTDGRDFRDFAIDRTWRYLKETIDFYIAGKLSDRDEILGENEIVGYEGFAMYSLKICQGYLKGVFEAKDIETFKKTTRVFLKLYRRLDEDRLEQTINVLERRDRAGQVANNEELYRRIKISKARLAAVTRIKTGIDQVWFGLSAHILERTKEDLANLPFFNELLGQLPSTLDGLIDTLVASRQDDADNYWGWTFWDLPVDGGVYSIDFGRQLDEVFAVKALKILSSISSDSIAIMSPKPSRTINDIYSQKGNSRSLNKVLEAMPEKYSGALASIISAAEIAKIADLKTILNKAIDAQEKADIEKLKISTLDPRKVAEFKAGLVDDFYDTVTLRKLMEIKKVVATTDSVGKKVPTWGFNNIDNKAVFVGDWHEGYGGLGEHFGNNMALSETEIVFKSLADGLADAKDVSEDDLIEEIGKSIKEKGLEDPVVLQSLKYHYEFEDLRNSKLFIPHYDQRCPDLGFGNISSFMGVLSLEGRAVPVFDVFVRQDEQSNLVAVVDIGKLGTWKQYVPIENSEEGLMPHDIFEIGIVDLNENDAWRDKIIYKNQNWLVEHGNIDEQREYLRQNVNIKVYEKFEYVVNDPGAGRLLKLSETKEK